MRTHLPAHRTAVRPPDPWKSACSLTPKELHARLDRPFKVEELTAGLDNETYLVTHP